MGDWSGPIATRHLDGRGSVACLEPVWLVFAGLFEIGGAALGCGRPRTSSGAVAAAPSGREAPGGSLRVACGAMNGRLRLCLESASPRASASYPEPTAALEVGKRRWRV